MTRSGWSRAVLVALCVALIAANATSLAGNAQASGFSIEQSTARLEFPEGIRFSLSASVTDEPARVELLYRAGGDATLHLVLPEAQITSDTIAVDEMVDLQSDFLPAGIELRYFWRFVSEDGGRTDTAEQVVLWHDTRFRWQPIASAQVTVQIYDLSEPFGREVLASAQRTVDELEAAYGLTVARPISMWVYGDTTALVGAQQINSREAIAGVAYPEYSVVNAAIPEGNHAEIGRVVPHEVSHLVLHQAAANPFALPPLWLDEGLAVYYQDGGKENYPRAVQQALAADELFSFGALGASFPLDPEETYIAYAQSLSAVTHILDRYGAEGMGRLLAAVGEGLAVDDALRTALGVDLTGFDREWRAWLTSTNGSGAAVTTASALTDHPLKAA